MQTRRLVWVAVITLALLPTAGGAAPPAALAVGPAIGAAPQRHPQMEAALASLRAARNQLHGAATVYNGHRINAERAADQAIAEVQEALTYAATKRAGHPPAAPALLPGNRKPRPGYPAMHAALAELRNAQAHLNKGATDFGGHRVNALRATSQAIAETVASLNFVHSAP